MNPIEQLTQFLQGLAASVPDVLQPVIIALAGAIPFVEGELASVIGVLAGMNPIVAGVAAAAGNFLCVLAVVTVGARAREAVVARRNGGTTVVAEKPESKGRRRFTRFLVRFGVPGASILGPLAMPTQFTSAILVGTGVPKAVVLFWQAVAIAVWTAFTTLVATGAIALAQG